MLTNRAGKCVYDQEILALWDPSRGDNQRHPCPKCSPERKSVHRHERVLSLSRSEDALRFSCHHCGFEGAIPDKTSPRPYIPPVQRTYMPEAARLTPLPIEEDRSLSEAARAWFAGRGISEATLTEMGVWSAPAGRSEDVIRFPYTTGGNVYALKMRAYPEKKFHCQGAPATLFGIDQVAAGEDLVICEGEIDQLSLREAGIKSAVSVPNGAPVQVSDRKIDPENDRKYQAVWSARTQLEEAKRIIIACDGDAPGQALAEELARRIGKARCWRIDWPDDCKDANDVLVKLGKDKLAELIANPVPWPIQGVRNPLSYSDQIDGLYAKGLGRGESTGFPNVDELYTVEPGHLVVVTGTPGSGKTALVNQLAVNLAKSNGWTFAIQSSEIDPALHVAMLAALYVGKPFFDGTAPRMTPDELRDALTWVDDHFVMLFSDGTAGVPDTIERLETAVLRKGVRGVIIDPASYLRIPEGAEAVGHMLEEFKNFAMRADAVIWLIAHPFKMRANADGSTPVPRGYEISGSSAWVNRADCGITIHRPSDNRNITEFHVWKSRYSWISREGSTELHYDVPTGRYSEQPFPYTGPPVIYSCFKPEDAFDFQSNSGIPF